MICVLLASALKSQQAYIDSLKLSLKNAKHDTVRCQILSYLAENAPGEEWHLYNDTMYAISEKKLKGLSQTSPEYKNYMWYYALALNNKGYLANQEGEIEKALEYYNKSIELRIKIDDKPGLAACYNNTGYIYKTRGNIPMAVEYYGKALKIQEANLLPNGEPVNKKGMAYTIHNLGLIYKENGEVKKAEEYYKRALKLRKEVNDIAGIGHSLNNIGFIYYDAGDLDKALGYFKEALKFREETGDKSAIANSLHNLGHAYEKKGDIPLAAEYFSRCIQLQEETNDNVGLSRSLVSMARIIFSQNKIQEALKYALRGKELASKIGSPANISNAATVLFKIYKSAGDYEKAFENYKLHIQMSDSVTSETNRKASYKSQLKYEYEKKAAADSVRVAEEKKVITAQLKQERTQRYFLFGGLFLAVMFSVFMINRFRLTNKQKKIIEEQKNVVEQQKAVVEEKQREVLDSIHYAKRIQQSLLPNEVYISKILRGKRK